MTTLDALDPDFDRDALYLRPAASWAPAACTASTRTTPLPMEPIEWTPVEEGTVMTLPLADASFGVTATLKFDVVLAEPRALRSTPATAAMMTLVNSVEEIIRRMSSLA